MQRLASPTEIFCIQRVNDLRDHCTVPDGGDRTHCDNLCGCLMS